MENLSWIWPIRRFFWYCRLVSSFSSAVVFPQACCSSVNSFQAPWLSPAQSTQKPLLPRNDPSPPNPYTVSLQKNSNLSVYSVHLNLIGKPIYLLSFYFHSTLGYVLLSYKSFWWIKLISDLILLSGLAKTQYDKSENVLFPECCWR